MHSLLGEVLSELFFTSLPLNPRNTKASSLSPVCLLIISSSLRGHTGPEVAAATVTRFPMHELSILPLLEGEVEDVAVWLKLHVAPAETACIIIHAHSPEHRHGRRCPRGNSSWHCLCPRLPTKWIWVRLSRWVCLRELG